MPESAGARKPNRLVDSTSPYLRQHAYNPVDWYPWGPEAIERARRENRPILLSIGYSACHWCHVMAHESFEDNEIARLMNEQFVCIKVDREQRPDVDQVYQVVCQLLTGQGGWPLTVFLTPDLMPYYAGTYFPPRPRFGRPGFPQVLEACARAYRERPEEVRRQAARLAEAVGQVLDPAGSVQREAEGPGEGREAAQPAGQEPSAGELVTAAGALLRQADREAGGFGGAPKFPHACGLELLLRAAWRFGHRPSLDHLLLTLQRMALGGVFDQVGGGFHRYAVDRWWQLPHFEKMLYDNALLVPLYVRVGLWQRPALLSVAARTLDFMLDEMRLPGGGFAASLDADSPGADGRPEEGAFYRWRPDEVKAALQDDRLAEEICLRFAIGPQAALHLERVARDGPPGWTEEAQTVPGHMPGLPEPDLGRLGEAWSRMKAYRRQHRQPPARDGKVLLGWHSLALSALVAGYQAGIGSAPERYLRAAGEGWEFVEERLTHPKLGLLHTPAAGAEAVPAFADDHAFLIHAALDLYRCTQRRTYLDRAAELSEQAVSRFCENGVYFLSSAEHRSPLARPRDLWDQATPSPNAAMAAAHARLFALLDDPQQLERGRRVIEACWPVMVQHVSATAALWCALDSLDGGSATVTLLAPQLDQVRGTLARLVGLPHPALEVRWQPEPGGVRFVLCRGTVCNPPDSDVERVVERLTPAVASAGS